MLKINKIENIDCHIYLKKIDTNSINLIVIDPPYNELPKKWDNFKSWNFIKKEFLRILKKKWTNLHFWKTTNAFKYI